MPLDHPPLAPREHVHLDIPLRTGSQATVWRATTDEGRVVAAKVARRSSPEAVRALEAEARALTRCAGPHVLPLLGTRETEEHLLLALPLAESNLADVLAARGPLPSVEVRRIALAVLLALRSCHRAGMVHGDVKPENVLAVEAGDWHLGDFGIAVPVDHGPGTLALVGSAAWLDPVHGPAHPRRDLWALAAMSVEALTGHLPFEGTSPQEMMASAERGLASPVVVPGDAELAAFLTRALDPDPARRPSVQAWLRLLTDQSHPDPASEGTAALDGPLGRPRADQLAGERRGVAMVAAAGILAVTGAALALVEGWLRLGG